MLIVNALQTPPLFIANEAFRGLPKWQAVLRRGEHSALCDGVVGASKRRGRYKRSA